MIVKIWENLRKRKFKTNNREPHINNCVKGLHITLIIKCLLNDFKIEKNKKKQHKRIIVLYKYVYKIIQQATKSLDLFKFMI